VDVLAAVDSEDRLTYCFGVAARLISSSDAGFYQGGRVTKFFAEIGGAHNAAHDFRVSRLWDIGDKHDFFGASALPRLDGERVF
jgi:hypothetical protein